MARSCNRTSILILALWHGLRPSDTADTLFALFVACLSPVQVMRAIMVGKWQSWGSSKDKNPAGKMANTWMVKTLGRGMLPKTQEDENVQFTPRMANAYAKVLEVLRFFCSLCLLPASFRFVPCNEKRFPHARAPMCSNKTPWRRLRPARLARFAALR